MCGLLCSGSIKIPCSHSKPDAIKAPGSFFFCAPPVLPGPQHVDQSIAIREVSFSTSSCAMRASYRATISLT